MSLFENDILATLYSELYKKKAKEQGEEKESCQICFDEISENRKWTAFHKCGHRACCDCFKSFVVDRQGKKHCPTCRAVISLSVTLEGIY